MDGIDIIIKKVVYNGVVGLFWGCVLVGFIWGGLEGFDWVDFIVVKVVWRCDKVLIIDC